MSGRHLLIALLVYAVPLAGGSRGESPEKPSPEENILRKAGVPTDDDGLLAFFRGRTLGDAERKRIDELIRRLGGQDFDDREAAANELKKSGARARPLIQAAVHGSDPEIASRAKRLLNELKPFPREPIMAGARLLARRAPTDTVPVLLDYLPCADHELVDEQVLAALLALTPDGGKAAPALVAALDDPQPLKRAAAAYVLGRKGDTDEREAVRTRLEDADARVRWQAAVALLAAHERAAVPTLVNLLADGPLDTAARAEDVLLRLAGEDAPAVAVTDVAATRHKCRDAWAAWWKEKEESADIGQYQEAPPPLGYILGVEYNTGRVWECDVDGAIRWVIRDLSGPMDAQMLPNGNALIAEANAKRITERDATGTVLWEKKIDGEPNGCLRLPNGHTFVSTTGSVMEFDAGGSTVYCYELRLPSNAILNDRHGRVVYALDKTVGEFDSSSHKHVKWIDLPPQENVYVDIEALPGGRFLATHLQAGCVFEVSPDGEVLWKALVPGACGATRLSNGHTLVATNHKIIELDSHAETVRETKVEGYPRRIHAR
jgi:hypothetical protein